MVREIGREFKVLVVVGAEIALLMDGLDPTDADKLPILSKSEYGKDYGKGLRDSLVRDLDEGGWKYLESLPGGTLTFNAKADLSVNSGMRNCNPSRGCAKHCYVTSGLLSMRPSQAKSALMDLLARRDRVRLGGMIARDFKWSDNYTRGLMLRFFDKGEFDGDVASESAWLKVIQEVNRNGIPVQVFSKKPQILEEVDPKNVRLLSVDSSMMYDENGKKLPKSKWHPALKWALNPKATVSLAITYQGPNHPGELEFINMLWPVLQANKGVVMPVVLSRGRKMAWDEVGLGQLPKGIKAHFCQLDVKGGRNVPEKRRASLSEGVDLGPREMQCTTCNSNATGLGCYFMQQAHAKFASMQADTGRRRKKYRQ